MGSFMGKILNKLTKAFRPHKLPSKEKLDIQQILQTLFICHNNLGTMQQGLSAGWFEGEAFYEFFKSGGLNNVTDLFIWLSQMINSQEDSLITQKQHLGIVVIFEDCCTKITQILQNFI